MRESISQRTRRIQTALGRLKDHYPEPVCALKFKNPYELTVATILSAQCTDDRVNQTTPALFEAFPDAKSLAKAKPRTLEKLIFSTGFYRNKAKNLIALGKALERDYGGSIPRQLNQLEQLPGIGRKTANVVLGNAFGIPSGIAVDTHVTRQMNLLGVVETTNAMKIEAQLKEMVPQTDWIQFTHYFITHGRETCVARRPKCDQCVLASLCPSNRKG